MKIRAALLGAISGALLLLVSSAVVLLAGPSNASAGTYHCTKWRGTSTATRTCVKFTNIAQHYNIYFRDGVFNQAYHQTIPLSCETSKATTWTWGVSASVKAEAGVIFAKAETEISGSIQHSTTTTYTSSSTIQVPARHWGHCWRGQYTYSASGTVRRDACSDHACTHKYTNFNFHAPTVAVWKMGLGRP